MLEFTITAILEKLVDTKEFKYISKKILDNEAKVPKENYDFACVIFNETSKEIFQLGFKTCLEMLNIEYKSLTCD